MQTTCARGFDSTLIDRMAIATSNIVLSGIITRHTSRTTTGSPRNGSDAESSGRALTSLLTRTDSAAESFGEISLVPSIASGTPTPGDRAKDHVGGDCPVTESSWPERSRGQGWGEVCGWNIARVVRASCVNNSTSILVSSSVSRTNNIGAPVSVDGIATTAPSESSHCRSSDTGATNVEPTPPAAPGVAAPPLAASDRLARSHALSSNTSTIGKTVSFFVIRAAEATVRRDPNATHRDDVVSRDPGGICIANARDSIQRHDRIGRAPDDLWTPDVPSLVPSTYAGVTRDHQT